VKPTQKIHHSLGDITMPSSFSQVNSSKKYNGCIRVLCCIFIIICASLNSLSAILCWINLNELTIFDGKITIFVGEIHHLLLVKSPFFGP